jgi:uncharacterized membrane protein
MEDRAVSEPQPEPSPGTDPAPSTEPAFSATLTPNRSLGPQGFLILMAALSAVSFITGIAFALVGAWPVLGFFGLDIVIVYVAFKLSYRSGRLYERVDIAGDDLVLTRVHPSGRAERYSFPAYWVRVLLDLETDGRTRLALASHGRQVVFGSFLTNEERESFAAALRRALTRAKQTEP